MTKRVAFASILLMIQLSTVSLNAPGMRVVAYSGVFQRSSQAAWLRTRPAAITGCKQWQLFSPFHSASFVFRKIGWDDKRLNRISGLHNRLESQRDGTVPEHVDWNKSKDNSTDSRSLVEETFSVLARKGRTWRRLRHLVDLACSDTDKVLPISEDSHVKAIADIGCDHGLLAIGLAVSGKFDKVIGVDASEHALQDGAISFHKELIAILEEGGHKKYSEEPNERRFLPVDFRVGDGLLELHPGEADAICIAGMGVNTMLKILCQREASNEKSKGEEELAIDKLHCQRLLLQPTNSKPRNLILLYDRLQSLGWSVSAERIEKLSSRWYISTCFVRNPGTTGSKFEVTGSASNDQLLPGQKLTELEEIDPMRAIYNDYVQHHVTWLQKDLQKKGSLGERELRWLEMPKKPKP